MAETFAKEIGKLERMNTQSAEYSVQSNYLDLLLDLPWNITSEDNFDLPMHRKSSTRTTTGSKRSRSASSNTSPC